MAAEVMHEFLCWDMNILSLAVGTLGVLVGSRFVVPASLFYKVK